MRTEPNEAAILLNLSNQLLAEIDGATDHLECSRTHFLRQSIRRNIEYFKNCELPVLNQLRRSRDEYEQPVQPQFDGHGGHDEPTDDIAELFADAY